MQDSEKVFISGFTCGIITACGVAFLLWIIYCN